MRRCSRIWAASIGARPRLIKRVAASRSTYILGLVLTLSLAASSHASADVSAIAFERDVPFVEDVSDPDGIWAVPAGGGEATLLVPGGINPSFAPDGDKLAFLGSQGGVQVANIDGTSPTTVFNFNLISGRIEFGPGGQVAFATETNGGNNANAIRAVDADGSNLHTVYTAPAVPAGYNLGSPAFSPSGTQIAFAQVNFPFAVPDEGLWTVNSNGSSPAPLSDGREPAYSPDGTRIAFQRFLPSSTPGELQADLFVSNVNGTGATNITNTVDQDEAHPAYSPDGTRIAFAARPVGVDVDYSTEHIETIAPDGSGRTDLTSAVPGAETMPTWANVAALPVPPGSGGEECEKARAKLAKAKTKLKKLRRKDAPQRKIKKAKKKVSAAKQAVKSAC